MINFTNLISKISKVSQVSQQNCESRMGTCQADAQHSPRTYLPLDSVSIVSRQSVLDQVRAVSVGLSARVWKHVAMIFAVLVMSMANIGMAWGASGVITAASTTDLGKGNTPRYVVEQAGVGRLMRNATGSSSWTVSSGKLQTGSNLFALQTYNDISSIVITGYGTGSNRTFSSMRVGTTTGNYAAAAATGTGTMSSTESSQTITITPSSTISANSYVEITLSGNIYIYSVELVYASSCTSRTFESGQKIFFKDASGDISGIGAKWKADGKNIYAYFWNDTENAWSTYGNLVSGSWNAANAIYEFTVPGSGKTYTKVLFTRGSAASWGGKEHQTSDQQPCIGDNMYVQNTSAAVDGKYNGSWSKYAPGPALIGDFNNWDPDQGKFVDAKVTVELEAETDYEFKVLNGDGTNDANYWSCTLCAKATNTTEPWQVLYTNQNNWSMRSAEAGEYCFHWDNTNHYLGIYYPQARFKKNTYIYFDVTRETYWNQAAFDAKFYFKYYDSGSDLTGMPLSCTTPLENYVYYAVVPNNDYVGRVQMNRYVNSAEDGIADVCYAYSRSSSLQNCMIEETGKENYKNSWTPQWTTYCPPMSSATLSDNSTTVIAGTSGNGTAGSPYIVPTSGTIQVQASATSAVPDGNMTKMFDFKVDNTSQQNSTAATYSKGSLSNNTVYQISVDAYNTYNETNGTKSTPALLYYKALNQYSVTIDKTNVTKSSGAEGANAVIHTYADYVAVFAPSTGYTLPASVTVTRGGSDITSQCAWVQLTGTLTIPAAQITGNIVITITGVAKTTAITLDKNNSDPGSTSGSATATYGSKSLTSLVHATRTGYTQNGYETSDHTLIIKADETFDGTHSGYTDSKAWANESAEVTLYARWTANKFNVTHTLSNVTRSSGGEAGSNKATYGTAYSVVFAATSGYALPATVTVTVGGGDVTANCTWNQGTGTLTIPAAYVTGDIVITVTGVIAASVSATLLTDTYVRTGSSDVQLSVSVTGASSGWYYRIHNTKTNGYHTPDKTTYSTTTWTMTSGVDLGENPLVVELYNGSNVKIAESSTITVYGETGHPMTISAGDGGSASPTSTWANGDHLHPTITATPSSGYRFVNWTLSNANATLADATSASTTITSASGACTITANFVECSTVTYMYNGATGGATPASATAASVTLPTPTRTSYVFDGWYTTAGTKVGDGGDTYDVVADITLYARWETTCGGGGTLFNVDFTDETTETISTANSGATFVAKTYDGYNMSFGVKSGKDIDVTNGTGIDFKSNNCEPYQCLAIPLSLTKDNEVTATITLKSSGTVKYKWVSGSLPETPSFSSPSTYSPSSATNTLTYTPSSAGNYVLYIGRSGSGNGSQYVESVVITQEGGSGTCYHVYYHGNGAESGFVSDTTSYANSATATILDYDDSRYPLTKAGYTFQGWATSADGAVAKTAGQTVTISSADVHYYAVWAVAAPTYDITNGNPSHGTIAITDGSSAITSAEENATVHISATPADGYSFTSWSVTKDAGGSVDVATSSSTNPTTFTMPAEAVTVTATFSPNTYTITYNLNGASWAGGYSAPANYTVGTGATLPVAGDMTNIGYTFGGWYDNSGLTGSAVTEITTSDYGDKEYWAKWTENTYDVTYNANGGTGTTASQNGHYVTLRDNGFTAPSGKTFVEWNTASDGSGSSYNEGEEVELTANLALYAIWANDYTITWDEDAKLSGVAATPNLGGGNYTITASLADWTGSLTSSMISATTAGVTITNVAVDNSSSPKTITATFNVGASVEGTSITFQLDVPAADVYGAKSSTKDITIDRCTGSSSGSDGVLFSAEFKDSGLGTDNICDAANTPYTFTTSELKSAATGGSIKAYTTGNLSHLKYVDNGVYLKGTDGVIQIDLDNAISTNDLFEYVNVHSSNPNAYLRHTSASNTTGQIVLTGYSSRNVKVMLPTAFNGKTTLYIVKNSTDFKLHKAAIVRPAFLMLMDDSKAEASLSGTDVELTTSTYLSFMKGGHVYYTSPTSGDVKITKNDDKKYITLAKTAGYLKVVLDDALQEGDVIGYDTHNGSSEIAFTTTTTRSVSEHTSGQLYTVGSSSPLKGQTTFYIWYYSSSTPLRGLQIARSGVAGGGGGTDKITPTLTWSAPATVDKEVGQADFTYAASTTSNTLGAITYTSSNTSVATVNASGKVHIVGIGSTTITATLAASGCYNGANLSYTLNVTSGCDDVAGTIVNNDGSTIAGDAIEMNNCETKTIKVTGHTAADGVTYQWYKDGATISGATGSSYTIPAGSTGEYYVTVTNTGSRHCAMVSTNTITVTATSALSVSNIVNQWYVKNGRRTPDIALWQTEGASSFTVKNNSTSAEITSIGGCTFYLGEDGIIYLKGTKSDGAAPSDMSAGDLVIKVDVSAGCGAPETSSTITIHQQATGRASIAFVSVGTEGGAVTDTTTGYYKTTPLYISLDYTLGGGAFDLTAQNIYWTTNEKSIREHYSQFDAILITDDPNTKKVPKGVSGDEAYKTKGYVNAFGTMIDVRPILTMEAFVSALTNWGSKGVAGNPSSPSPRPYEMRLQCKDHEIYSGLPAPSPGTNVWSEVIDGEEYRHVVMVDKTKSPYAGLADDEKTSGKNEVPALQGFSSEAMGDLLGLGVIADATLHAGIERQSEPAARLMLLGINAKALPNALTTEGKIVIENALEYLLKTNMEEVDDCSNFFVGTIDSDWNKSGNWSKNSVPNYETRARILVPCVVSTTAHAAAIDIATGGTSVNKAGTCNGSLTINANGALIVGGEVRTATAPYFSKGKLQPTGVNDLVLNTNGSNQACLIFDNKKGDTKATVNLYSLGRKPNSYLYQYFAIPMEYLPVNPTFANEAHGGTKIYTYVWTEGTSSWTRRKYYDDLFAFEGLGITTNSTDSHMDYTMTGNLASTAEREITLTYDGAGNNIIGNSYTAPINIASLVTAFASDGNVTKTVYIYSTGRDAVKGTGASGSTETAGQWLAIPMSAAEFPGWGGLKVIPAMQAFLIQVTGETSMTLDYDAMVRSNTTNYTEKLHAPQRFADEQATTLTRLSVADSQTHTDLYLFEGDQFSEAFDNGWEAQYMEGDGRSAQLYAMASEDKMAVLASPELEGTQVGFAPGQETAYTFSFTGGTGTYYLNDIKAQKSALIQEGNTYSFDYENGDAANRFYISKTAIDAPAIGTGVDNTQSAIKVQKFIFQNKLYILRNGVLYDATGKVVK